MILGGSRYIIPVIQTAHDLGLYVITVDYLPESIAHKHSDMYCNISVLDRRRVLEKAKELSIDGIISFACDPGVVTAAYVAECMNLPFQCSYETAQILQDKGRFRQFLMDNGFNCPNAKSYADEKEIYNDIEYFNWPVIVKPTDSAGSKGVSKVDSPDKLGIAVRTAIKASHAGSYIVEDYLSFKGCRSDADAFTVNGAVTFLAFSDQLFDSKAYNPFTPAAFYWPSSMDLTDQDYLKSEIQRLMHLLKMRTGIYNIETGVGTDGKPYIMEVSPRGGGNRISELIKMAYKAELIEAEIRSSVGLSLNGIHQNDCDGYWCQMVIHSDSGNMGMFQGLNIAPVIKEKYMKLIDISVRKGDPVFPFTGANMAVGDVFLRFDSRDELERVMSESYSWLEVVLGEYR